MDQASDEYAALFRHSNDAIALIEFEGETPIIQEANPAFESTFAPDDADVTGRDLDEVVANGDQLGEARELSRKVRAGDRISREITRESVDGPREFYWQIIPIDDEVETIQRAFAMYTDISERLRREQELEEQNERLNEFAGIISHDLRNPLEVAQIRLDIARDECESEHLDVVARAHKRMEALIADVLTWAREGGEVSEVETIELAEAVDRCWDAVDTLEASVTARTAARIKADDSRLQQLLENLIRNAVEHAGEEVSVTIGELDDGFYVEDDGPGIPEDEREQVFEVGYSTRQEGTGFGLNIVREIANAHGWDIAVTESESGGARFEFTGVQME